MIKCINSLQVDFDVDIYVTGSNATLLSGELATLIAGRYVEIKIYPFSYVEFMAMYKTVYPIISDEEAFRKYLVFGGMPFLLTLKFDEESSSQYLRDIYTSVVLKDENFTSQLEKVKDNYPIYVVSLDEFDLSRNGIKHMNIRDFLKNHPNY